LRGFLVCLEGLDQSGKKSTARIIAARLMKIGYEVEVISFPDYNTPIGKEIRMFLQGKRDYGPEVRQFLYVANRFERKKDIQSWLDMGKVVIADRYTPSGIAYGLANGLDVDWMVNLERGLPNADVVIVIDVPAEVAYHREKKKDVYERDILFQRKVRAAYLSLAKKFNWVIINGDRPLDEVAEKVYDVVLRSIKQARS